jgi:hypothetical protein
LISALLNTPCTITRRFDSGTNDPYGNALTTTFSTNTVCELQQLTRRADAEAGGHGDLSDTQWALFLPAGTVIDTDDKVTVTGQVFEVAGAPWPVRDPETGTVSHVEANLRRVAAATDA